MSLRAAHLTVTGGAKSSPADAGRSVAIASKRWSLDTPAAQTWQAAYSARRRCEFSRIVRQRSRVPRCSAGCSICPIHGMFPRRALAHDRKMVFKAGDRLSLAGQARMERSDARFAAPPWNAPIDVASALRSVPDSATIAGMFIEPLCEAARRMGKPLPSARERYTSFRFYPLREHVQLLVESGEHMFAGQPLRDALRTIGRGAHRSLLASTVGKVVLASAIDVHQVLAAMVNTYPVHIRPAQASVVEQSKGRMIIRLEQVHFFVDSHHVAVFEGALHYAGVRGQVLIESYGPAAADLLCKWEQ
jgi:uncharacterized protein (TIGR02265 family)